MAENNTKIAPNAQKKYRKKQSQKGLKRFEIQVEADVKAQFDELVNAVADELPAPWDHRRRTALARAQVFNDITKNIRHEFFVLKDQLTALKEQVAALSPSFFKTDITERTPLPDAIAALPDDPKKLKSLLAKTYKETQDLKLTTKEHLRRADQYQSLYEAASTYNDELQSRLKHYEPLEE